MHAARFVVDVEHAAADHDRHKHGQRDGAGQQVLHVLDVGIELDRIERDLLHDARGIDVGLFSALISEVNCCSSVELMKLSVLSTTSAMRGWFCS